MHKKFSVAAILGSCAGKSIPLTAGLVLAVAGSVAFVLLPPLVLERIINALLSGTGVTLALTLSYFGCWLLSGVFDALKELLITVFGQKITRTVRSLMCAKLSRLPAAYFSANEAGVTAARFVGDVDTLETLFASGVVGMFVDACKIVGILCVVFIKSTGLGLLLLLVTPLLFLFTRRVQKNMLDAQLKNRASVGFLTAFVPETLRNLRMLHVFRREEYMEEKYDRRVQQSYDAVDRANFYDAVYSPVVLIVSAVLVAVMMVLAATGGAMQQLFGMSVGTAVAVIAYVGKVFSPLENIGMEIQTVQSAVAGVRRIRAFMDAPERPQADAAAFDFAAAQDAVALDNVCFSYDGQTPVLKGLSFAVRAGEGVTFAGRTGAGKSTLFKLLLGFYAPQEGSVRVFGRDAAGIPDACKRKLFGYVGQSFRAVPGTVFDQIAVFDPAIGEEAVCTAARLAGLHTAILALPQGYATPYADSLFSQGQQQLLAVARAVAADPKILLLDEMTANLDADTEAHVLAALDKAARERTVLSISHRLYEQTGGRVIHINE